MNVLSWLHANERKTADWYFESNPLFWKSVYETASLQSAIYQSRKKVALSFFERLELPPDARVLEIGCGAGVLAVDVARKGYKIEALDTATAMLELTSERARAYGVDDRVKVRAGDINSLECEEESADAIFAIGVLPWTATISQPLAQIRRVLKKGGHCILTVDNRKRLSYQLDPLLPLRRAIGRGLRSMKLRDCAVSRTHTIAETNEALVTTGFANIMDCTLGFGPFTIGGIRVMPERLGLHLGSCLQKKADQVPWLSRAGAQYIVLARRVV